MDAAVEGNLAIRARGLTKEFGHVIAVNDLNLDIPRFRVATLQKSHCLAAKCDRGIHNHTAFRVVIRPGPGSVLSIVGSLAYRGDYAAPLGARRHHSVRAMPHSGPGAISQDSGQIMGQSTCRVPCSEKCEGIAKLGGDATKFVPPSVKEQLLAKSVRRWFHAV